MNQEIRGGETPFPLSSQLAERLLELRRANWQNPLFRNWHARRQLEGYLKIIEGDGKLTPEIGESVISLAEEYGFLVTERLIENWLLPDSDVEINFSEYRDLQIKAYERFGKKVGAYFGLSYKPAIIQGLSGQEYFDLVAQAVKDQGRLVARWFAYGLPEVLAVGGDPHEYRRALKRVYQAGKTKIMKTYAHQAPKMEAYDFTLSESADYVVETISQLGEELGFWVVRHMETVNELGYHPYLFSKDTQRLLEEKGERAARWYASGFAGFLATMKFLNTEIEDRKTGYKRNWPPSIEELERGKTLLDPQAYKEEYLRLLATVGQGGATFLARCMGGLREDVWRSVDRGEKMVDLRCFADEIIVFKTRVSKKVFNQTVWFLPKIASRRRFGKYRFYMGINRIGLFLKEITELYEEEGEEITINAIRYTHGIRRWGGFPYHIIKARRARGGPFDPCANEELLPWSEFLDLYGVG